MLNKNEFDLLYYLLKNKYSTQRDISDKLGFSLGKTNNLINTLKQKGFLNETNELSPAAKKELSNYKVDNAVIMAAGTSLRLIPISYEKPKGLLKVKGEVLIERQIKQLYQAGINNIIVVTGYMAEKFFYLQEKFGVKIVLNEDYYKYNNTSTLIRVLCELKNTYICSSDNYYSENIFKDYVYRSYYCAVFVNNKSEEYGMICNSKGRLCAIDHKAENMWVMMGAAYFDRTFSEKFGKILQSEYQSESVRYELWENLLERHLDELEIYIEKYDASLIKEFDSLKDLREFDNKYIQNSGSEIFNNICSALNCTEDKIINIETIKEGLTNLSFKFTYDSKPYIYRHPGNGTDDYISRESEAFSMKYAYELGLDKSLVNIDAQNGWKLSRFIENAHILDYRNKKEVVRALNMIKKLHDAKIKSDFDFNIWLRTLDFIKKTSAFTKDINGFDELFENMKELYKLVEADNIEKTLCHCDCYNMNFLVDEKGEITLIDWEYSGNDDPASDLGTFICCSDYTFDEALEIFDIYYDNKYDEKQLRHNIAYISIASYYWYIWALYQESIGSPVGEYLLLWYNNTKFYMNKAFEMYNIK